MGSLATAALVCAAAGHAYHDGRWFVVALGLAGLKMLSELFVE